MTEHPVLCAIRDRPADAAILLDFDGTLAPIASRPELAVIQPGARDALESLSRAARVVAVISGRPMDELAARIGVPGVRLIGLYGRGTAGPGGPAAPPGLLRDVFAVANAVPGTAVETKPDGVAVHYRQARDPYEAADRLRSDLRVVADAWSMEVLEGKRVLELAPDRSADKGVAVRSIIRAHRPTTVLYAGDDRADIAAFEALEQEVAEGVRPVRVAVRGAEMPPELAAAADLVVEGPRGLVDLLRSLTRAGPGRHG